MGRLKTIFSTFRRNYTRSASVCAAVVAAFTIGCEGSEIVANLTIEEIEATDPELPSTHDTDTSSNEEVQEETDTGEPGEASYLGSCAGWRGDYEGDLVLNTRKDIEHLYHQDPGFNHIMGNLIINGYSNGDIQELKFINCIEKIDGNLIIENNSQLDTIGYNYNYLPPLEIGGDIRIVHNENLPTCLAIWFVQALSSPYTSKLQGESCIRDNYYPDNRCLPDIYFQDGCGDSP